MSASAPQSAAYQYDLFISYVAADETWVRDYFVPHMHVSRERILIESDYEPGEARIRELTRAIDSSRLILLLWRQEYKASPWASFVELLATQRSWEGRKNNVITLWRDSSPLSPHLSVDVALSCRTPEECANAVVKIRKRLDLSEDEPWTKPENPYPGLRHFDEKQARFFFGRQKEIEDLCDRVSAQRLTVLLGDSGCGKSSLVHAGLVPRLAQSGWTVQCVRASDAAANGVPQCPAEVQERGGRFLLVIDQFEEAFTEIPDAARPAFFDALAKLRATPRCALLLPIRADFYGFIIKWPLGELHGGEKMDLPPLTGKGLRDAIVEPAKANEVYVEERLLDRLLIDCAAEPAFLPMLQQTMALLWDRMSAIPMITLDAYEKLGQGRPGISTAISESGNAAMSELADPAHPGRRAIAWRILLRLVQFGENRADTRRRQPVDALRSASEDPREFQATLDCLVSHRLSIVSDPGRSGAQKFVDLAHEALIDGWDGLRECIAKRRDAEKLRRNLVAKADEWIRLGRGRAALLDQTELEEAEQWMRGADAAELGFPADLEALARASRKELVRLRWASWRRRTIVGLSVAATLTAAVIAYRYYESSAAAAQAVALLQHDDPQDNQRAMDSATRAVKYWATSEAVNVLQEARQRVNRRGLYRMDGRVSDLAVTSGGLLAFAGEEGAVHILDPKGGKSQTLVPEPPTPLFFCVAARPASHDLAAGAQNGEIVIWNMEDGAQMKRLPPRGSQVTSLLFSSDGGMLAAGMQDGRVELWDVGPYSVRRELKPDREGRVNRMSFSADGKFLAAAYADDSPGETGYTARLWDLNTGAALHIYKGHRDQVTSIVFEPGQKYVVTVSGDGVIREWEINSGRMVKEIAVAQYVTAEKATRQGISAAAMDASGRLAIGYSAEDKAELWDVKKGVRLREFRGIGGQVTALALWGAREDETLFTAESGGSVRDYPFDTGRLLAMLPK